MLDYLIELFQQQNHKEEKYLLIEKNHRENLKKFLEKSFVFDKNGV